jgi:hypothetical protein
MVEQSITRRDSAEGGGGNSDARHGEPPGRTPPDCSPESDKLSRLFERTGRMEGLEGPIRRVEQAADVTPAHNPRPGRDDTQSGQQACETT